MKCPECNTEDVIIKNDKQKKNFLVWKTEPYDTCRKIWRLCKSCGKKYLVTEEVKKAPSA
jgi:ssDNA-binding Zn-finger/Zn-ribbon topoisomerase 1